MTLHFISKWLTATMSKRALFRTNKTAVEICKSFIITIKRGLIVVFKRTRIEIKLRLLKRKRKKIYFNTRTLSSLKELKSFLNKVPKSRRPHALRFNSCRLDHYRATNRYLKIGDKLNFKGSLGEVPIPMASDL